MAVRRAHHGGFDALIAQSGDAPGPISLDHGSPFELEAQPGEKQDSGVEGFHDNADVVHPLKRHAAILAGRKDRRQQGRGCQMPRVRVRERPLD